MQCDHCDNKATVFYTQIIDGISKKASLCEPCANKKGVTDPEGFLLGKDTGALSKPSAPTLIPKLETSMGKESTRCCPGCGDLPCSGDAAVVEPRVACRVAGTRSRICKGGGGC